MLKTDCVHFPLDRPCVFHKKRGVKCSNCGKYLSINKPSSETKILVIKLNAMGDVLRTTFVLPGLKKRFPRSEITWITDPASIQILEKNPYISRVVPFDSKIFSFLAANKFDYAVNLDLSPESLGLMDLSFARKRIGFTLDGNRKVVPSNPAAKHWLQMSAFDDAKKKNKRTYQYWMASIAALAAKSAKDEIYVPLSKFSLKKAASFAKRHGLSGKTVIGINPGAGKRWKLKKWTDRGFLSVIKALSAKGYKIILFGGCDETGLVNSLVKRAGGKVISAGTSHSIPDFFAMLNLCKLVICGDTLAMHAALGLGKKVVGIFGPTSSAEIEMYGRGIKVKTPKNCACCYIQTCGRKPACMEMIKPEQVVKAVEKLLRAKEY